MALLDDVKEYLDITWSDPHTDSKVTGIVSRSQSRLAGYAGCNAEELDLSEESDEKQLFLDICRYIYNNASEDLEDNYCADLIMLRAKHKTEAMTDESEETNGSTGS